MEEITLGAQGVCFQMLDFVTSKSNSVLKSNSKISVRNYFFLNNYVTSKGAVVTSALH